MLELYKNIKKQRQQLNLTQTELAQKLGYADKSMIAKIEKGQIDLPQSKIIAFAEALQVSPSYLMGWNDTNTGEREEIDMIVPHDYFEKNNIDKTLISSPLNLQFLSHAENAKKGDKPDPKALGTNILKKPKIFELILMYDSLNSDNKNKIFDYCKYIFDSQNKI